MSRIKELREQQARIATNARAKFDEITDDTTEARAVEIEAEFDGMMADHDAIGQKIERLEKLEAAERAVAEPDRRRPSMSGEGRGSDDAGVPDYRTAFHAYLRAQGNVGAMAPEERAALTRGYEAVTPEQRAQTTTDAAGGYTVPTELMNILVQAMAAWGPMFDAQIVTELVTNGGNVMTMPTVDDTAVTPVAHTEGATLTDDGGKDVTFGQKSLEAYAFDTEWLRVSKELADDSIFAMESILGQLLGERLARLANTQLTTGSGTNAPHGIATASSQGKVAASTSAITWDEIMDLQHSVDPAYRVSPRTRFMFNDATLNAVRKLKDGDGNYLWQMGDVTRGVPASFNGQPYSINQAMASLTDGVDSRVMIFGDLSKYYVRKVGQPLVGALQDKDFWPGFGVAGYIRFDGELADTKAVKHLALAAA